MDSRAAVKRALEAALSTPRSSGLVVWLAGAWGSGKTHLWREVSAELKKNSVRTAYVSLFGLASIAEVKNAIWNESLLSRVSENSKKKQVLGWFGNLIPEAMKLADNAIGFDLLSRTLDVVRLLPEGTVVCLDDLERVSDAIRVEDILGLAGFLA